MNGNTVTYGNILATLVIAGSLASWVNSIASAGDATAADLDKHVAVDEVHDKYVKEELKDIKELLKQLTENQQ